MLDVRSLPLPVLASPMAGGPSSPELVAAVSRAGGLGMLAGGSIRATPLAEAIEATRELLGAAPSAAAGGGGAPPFGVNLFVPRTANTAEHKIVDRDAHDTAVAAFRATAASLLEVDPADLGTPNPDDDEEWTAKLAMLERAPVALVTFTFGLPKKSVFERLHVAGTACGVMVTNAADARAAVKAGADVIIAQGAEAGGHRSTWRVSEMPNDDDMLSVVEQVRDAFGHPGEPSPAIIAAGGIDGPDRFAAARNAGAHGVQIGTALLLTNEAGTKPTVRRALTDPDFDEVVATRAYSGRVARCLRTRFVDLIDPLAPPAYPDVNQITAPARASAEAGGDVHGVSAYAGVGWREARAQPAAEIVRHIIGH